MGAAATKAANTIIGHCILRALADAEGGVEAAVAKFGPGSTVSKWGAVKAVAKVSPKASRVAEFIVLWAIAMQMEGGEQLSITEYQRFWDEGERQTYRRQNEFRDLWPEFETPHELAAQVVKDIDARMSKKDAARLPLTLQVVA